MKEGVYLALDNRANQPSYLTPFVRVLLHDDGRLRLVKAGGVQEEILAVPDEHPDFVDSVSHGMVVLPFPNGTVELEWVTPARLIEYEARLDLSFHNELVEMNDAGIQTELVNRMFRGYF